MKKYRLFCLLLALFCILPLAGCKKELSGDDLEAARQGISAGNFNETMTVYANEWSNISMEIPAGFVKYSDADLESLFGAGCLIGQVSEEDDEIDPQSTASSDDGAQQNTKVAFLLNNKAALSNIQYTFETVLEDMDEDAYLMAVQGQVLSKVPNAKANSESAEEVTLADQKYKKMSFTVADGAIQDVYVLKKNGYMNVLIFVYTPAQKDMIAKMVDSIKTADAVTTTPTPAPTQTPEAQTTAPTVAPEASPAA